MSKVKNAELEERALEVASIILDAIELEVNNDSINVDRLKKLVDTYNNLKPYF